MGRVELRIGIPELDCSGRRGAAEDSHPLPEMNTPRWEAGDLGVFACVKTARRLPSFEETRACGSVVVEGDRGIN